MPRIDDTSISTVLDVYLPERARLIELLASLTEEQWSLPTECPKYSVKGIAAHILGDDFSLLSRQRDHAIQGLVFMAERMPGADFRALLNGFNDQWVEASRFFSPAILLELLQLTGQWTYDYYRSCDPNSPGEPVMLFGGFTGASPFWQAIAREYLERWAHHSQIRRALGLDALADSPFLDVGHAIIATVAAAPTDGADAQAALSADTPVTIGPLIVGLRQQAADILTLKYQAEEVSALIKGPQHLVDQFALRVGRQENP